MTIYTTEHVYCNFCFISEEKFTMFKQLLIKPILIFKNPFKLFIRKWMYASINFKKLF